MSQNFMVKNRSGELVPLDIKEIQKKTIMATEGIAGVDRYELETRLKIQFFNGITTDEIQQTIIKTACEMTDVDKPNYTYVAARAFLSDLYHVVGRLLEGTKGNPYSHSLKQYLDYGVSQGRINIFYYNVFNNNGFNLDELNDYIKPERDFQFTYLGIKTMYDRYLLKNKDGILFELPQHMFMAVAMYLAQNEDDPTYWAKVFYDVISKFEVMLATPTLSNARTNRPQLSSCFQGVTPDNIEGIFDAYKDMALVSKFGGGLGWDFTNIRASNGSIDDVAKAAGGLVRWMKIANDIAVAVDQLGVRRGAIAPYVELWHMDIYEFIDLKKNSGEERLRAHDLLPAVWIPDLFMERVEFDGEWTLFDPFDCQDLHSLYGDEFKDRYEALESDPNIRKEKIKAKDLWKKIILSYYETGTPFLGFKDEANRRNPNDHVGRIYASNLCTEIFQNTAEAKYAVNVSFSDGTSMTFEEFEDVQVIQNRETLETHTKKAKKIATNDLIMVDNQMKAVLFVEKIVKTPGDVLVCNLASVNLSKVSIQDMSRVIPVAVRMLDNVIDLNFYPIKQGLLTNKRNRAIGLGIMGEAEMLAKSGVYWGSQEHLSLVDLTMAYFSYYTIQASCDLAKERGSYDEFIGSKWNRGILPIDTANKNAKELVDEYKGLDWDALREQVKGGIRNGYLMAIAPTSTISILTGTTQCIEPVYKRLWFESNLSGNIPATAPNIDVNNYAYYTPAYDLNQIDLVKAAAIRQKYLDQGQSLNIFMSIPKAEGKYLNDIYMTAWKLGLKSTYYLRSESPTITKPTAVDRTIECAGCQ